ncbi:hypothetical protein CR513_00842, partial [Mucuna pruriens]
MDSYTKKGSSVLLTREQNPMYLKKDTWCSKRCCQMLETGEGNRHQTMKDPAWKKPEMPTPDRHRGEVR